MGASKSLRLGFIAIKTEDGKIKGKISLYCRVLDVSREAFRRYLKNRDKPWKYEALANEMLKIVNEDKCSDTYGKIRMYEDLKPRAPQNIYIPSEGTVYPMLKGTVIHSDKGTQYTKRRISA